MFASQSWLWIGSAAAKRVPGHLLAANLAATDILLLALYVLSMYFSVKSASIPTDEQSAKQQSIMAFVSPSITGYLGFRYAWPSAILIYWLTSNVIAICQQRYVISKFASRIKNDSKATVTRKWQSVPTAYLLFLLGREYSEIVDVDRARWIAWASLTSLTFGCAIFYATRAAAPVTDGGALSLLLIGVTATSLLAMILKFVRGSAIGF